MGNTRMNDESIERSHEISRRFSMEVHDSFLAISTWLKEHISLHLVRSLAVLLELASPKISLI